jgi:hypothetical protein
MAEERVQRRLATAAMAGRSRLMEQDKPITLGALKPSVRVGVVD